MGEAVRLVLQAAAIGRSGEALVLDMGEPVRIDDVARHLIQASGSAVEIHYTGLRVGEKLEPNQHQRAAWPNVPFGGGDVANRVGEKLQAVIDDDQIEPLVQD